jgi:hypothetical protein
MDFFAYSRRIPRAAIKPPMTKKVANCGPEDLELHVAAVFDGRRQRLSTG